VGWIIIIAPFVVLGIAVVFIAFSGSPGAARQAYLTRGGRAFTFAILGLYLVLGVVVPAAVIAAREESRGAVGALRTEGLSAREEQGKVLFVQACKSCHNLDAVNAQGVTGPDLDELGGLDSQRVLNAIKRGGSGEGRMPPNLYDGEDAQDVALYVSRVAGQ
jgi:mono/diheme cytochrome c family protein